MIMEVTMPRGPIPTFEPDGTLSAPDAAWRWDHTSTRRFCVISGTLESRIVAAILRRMPLVYKLRYPTDSGLKVAAGYAYI
jgi:hypothetical protein